MNSVNDNDSHFSLSSAKRHQSHIRPMFINSSPVAQASRLWHYLNTPMRLNSIYILFLALALGVSACTSPQPTAIETPNTRATASPTTAVTTKPKIVATTSVICDITQEIAQNTIDLTCLIPAGTDPHVYQPKPSDRKAIEQAKLILYSGYGFEPDLIKLVKATQNSIPKVAVSEIAVLSFEF
ncbi:metal ABC transporter solute-binding protein, Zn/Mn family [Limnofasciculus baicalensis]|nr:zinc ABC transporter substrate-binding protein [Limnofasciculus baicalensis]